MSIYSKYPNISRLFLFTLLTVIALLLSDFLPGEYDYKRFFPYTGFILVLAVNYFMFRTENKTLDVLGFNLKSTTMKYLPIGLLLGIAAVLFGFLLKSLLTGDSIQFNREFDSTELLKQLYWILPTAATQEFICRSYGYKKLIETFNLRIANLVIIIVFVSMHDVFNIGIFGAIFYSISLIIGHFVFSSALLRSGTIYFSSGIHWGSNVANNQLFTDDQLAASILFLRKIDQPEPPGFNPLGILLYILAINAGFLLLWFALRKWKKLSVK